VERALTPWIAIAGTSHPLGFAGLTLSLALAPSFGVRAAAVVTGVSAQGLDAGPPDVPIASIAIDAALIGAQFRAVAELSPAAFHIGAQVDARAVRAVAQALAGCTVPIVVDPVIAASGGRRLADDATVAALGDLFARATLVTPNLDEAEILLGEPVRGEAAMRAAGQALRARFGAGAVLVKGGHLPDAEASIFDVLVDAAGTHVLRGMRQPGAMRGTGDALATAIAAHLARGVPLAVAVANARAIVADLIAHARNVGTMRIAPLGEI